jgi:hypothetical protein
VLTIQLARDLAAAGVLWQPRAGDRFIIDAELLTDEVFWIADLTVEVHHFEGQSLLGFNGTTEWALDAVTLDQALWLPREDQLRELLGDRLLWVNPAGNRWEVRYTVGDAPRTVSDSDLECAYARAILSLDGGPGGLSAPA